MSKPRIEKVIDGEVPMWKRPRDINHNVAIWSLRIYPGYFIRVRPSKIAEKITMQLETGMRARYRKLAPP